MTNAKLTVGTGFFIHHSSRHNLVTGWVDEFEIPQQGECVETTSNASFVICYASPNHPSCFDLCRKRGARPACLVPFRNRIHMSDQGELIGTFPVRDQDVRAFRLKCR